LPAIGLGYLRMMQPIKIDQLNPTQPLPWTLYDQSGKVLARKGLLLSSQEEILERLASHSLFVIPDSGMRALKPKPKPQLFKPTHGALNLYEECLALESHLGRALNTSDAGEFRDLMNYVVARVEVLVAQHFDLTFAFLVLTEGDNYPIAHQLHTGIVVAALMPKISAVPKTDYRSCIQAALTMNIGMISLQSMLLHQQTELTLEQRTAIRVHPEQGMQHLKRLGIDDPVWLQTVLEHHEKSNGTGYPSGKSDVCVTAELVGLADIFCAKVSTRGYRKSITPGQAARDLLMQQGGGGANPELAALLIREVGVYPPGTFVRLVNGDTAIVTRCGATAVTPRVISILGGSGVTLPQPQKRDCAQKEFAVAGVVPKEKIRLPVDPKYFWDLVCQVELNLE